MESELRKQLAAWLHHKLAAAQNLPYEEGDTCPSCFEDVDDILVRCRKAAKDAIRLECLARGKNKLDIAEAQDAVDRSLR